MESREERVKLKEEGRGERGEGNIKKGYDVRLTTFCRAKSSFSHFILLTSFLNISFCLYSDSAGKQITDYQTKNKYITPSW